MQRINSDLAPTLVFFPKIELSSFALQDNESICGKQPVAVTKHTHLK
jgi:hypothetical protein